MKIEDVIQQPKFESEYQKASINLIFTGSWFTSNISKTLRTFEISQQQFNILRILRGAGKALSVKELAGRMLDPASNASRLVDKLLEKNLAERTVCPTDRRQVEVIITTKGLDLVNKASAAVKTTTEDIFSNLNKDEAKELSRLLDLLRS